MNKHAKQRPRQKYQAVAKYVGELLKALGWNPTQAANHYGVSQPTVIRWQNGQYMPRPSIFRQMALDAVAHPDLRNFFEHAAGVKVDQIVMDRARHSSPPSRIDPNVIKVPKDHLERVFLTIYERLLLLYEDASSGRPDATNHLSKIMDIVVEYESQRSE